MNEFGAGSQGWGGRVLGFPHLFVLTTDLQYWIQQRWFLNATETQWVRGGDALYPPGVPWWVIMEAWVGPNR